MLSLADMLWRRAIMRPSLAATVASLPSKPLIEMRPLSPITVPAVVIPLTPDRPNAV